MAGVTDAQVREWKASTRMDHRIAAAIAAWAGGQEHGTVLPDNGVFGRQLGIEASPSTYWRAKRLLARHGLLASGDGPYHVA